jgi:hypothetical protein
LAGGISAPGYVMRVAVEELRRERERVRTERAARRHRAAAAADRRAKREQLRRERIAEIASSQRWWEPLLGETAESVYARRQAVVAQLNRQAREARAELAEDYADEIDERDGDFRIIGRYSPDELEDLL